ncbi:MAG TPA: hypothetical protein IAC41_08350 [Candidatus Merdenecus merdavium]|nr:hypothetical protein [Candidatus Merdenecus merdavium]
MSIDKQAFIDAWNDVDKAFDEVIDFMKSNYGIPVSKLLPYDALLVPFVYYFYKNKKKPEGENARNLKDYFWRCVLNKRFTEGVEGKIAIDCANVIDPILLKRKPENKSLEPVNISCENLKKMDIFL